jgi:23S rRNA (cytosine1962-C5)-methyltransferase
MNVLTEKISLLFSRLETESEVDSFRMLHGRGRCFPGLEFVNVDFFQPVLLVTCYQECSASFLEKLMESVRAKLSSRLCCLVLQKRYLSGAPSELLLGALPEFVCARRGKLVFNLQFNAQQNVGYFLDMEQGRCWLEKHAEGKRVLNLFAYTCAFSVVALAAGAREVVNVDMSSNALNVGRDNHQRNGLPKEASIYLAENILKSWGRIKRRGPYDLVIIDPPSYQPGSFVATKEYAKLVRRLPELMPGGGLVLACLNAPELSNSFLTEIFQEQLAGAKFIERLDSHPDFPDVDLERQLKLLVYEISARLE